MRWINKIKDILGLFWANMFGDTEFILGVEKVAALFGRSQATELDNWYLSRVQSHTDMRQVLAPFSIYLPSDEIHATCVDFADILAGRKTLGDEDSTLGWSAVSLYTIADPTWLTDHALDATKTFVNGIDYTYSGTRFNFNVDPRTLGLSTVTILDSDGVLRICYVLFGWHMVESRVNDAVSGFIGSGLDNVCDLAWDMHTNGATNYNVKAMLAKKSKSVVSKNNGTVTDIWLEQGNRCLLVDDVVYSAPSSVSVNVSVGVSVSAGDVLFGSLRVYNCNDNPSVTEVPSIRVNTDVGELIALNETLPAIVKDSVNILPLQGTNVTKYYDRCVSLAKNNNALYIDVPNSVNPFKFIKDKLRHRRYLFITLEIDKLADIEPALECIRKSTSASSIVTVFIRATGETVTANVHGLAAEVGMMAVAECTTVKIEATRAEVTQLI